jgi:nucleoid-associated protein YgaU
VPATTPAIETGPASQPTSLSEQLVIGSQPQIGGEGFVLPLGQNPVVDSGSGQSAVAGLTQPDTLSGNEPAPTSLVVESRQSSSLAQPFERKLDAQAQSKGAVGAHGTTSASPKREDRWHTVVSGDSAFSIAKRYYGKGEYWKRLAKANGNRIGSEGQLRVGVRIKLPPAEDLGIRAAKDDVAKGADKSAPKGQNKSNDKSQDKARPSTDKPSERLIANARPYVIRKGDTLSTISQRELGTMKRAGEIMKLNKISDPGSLRVGATLQLPAT